MCSYWYSCELDTKFLSLPLVIKLEKVIAKQILKQFHDKTGVLGFFYYRKPGSFLFFFNFWSKSYCVLYQFFASCWKKQAKAKRRAGIHSWSNQGRYVVNWLCKQCAREHLWPPGSQSAEFLKYSEHQELQMKVETHLIIRFLSKLNFSIKIASGTIFPHSTFKIDTCIFMPKFLSIWIPGWWKLYWCLMGLPCSFKWIRHVLMHLCFCWFELVFLVFFVF